VEGEAPHFYFFDTFFTDRMLLGDGYKYEKVQKWTNMKANTRDYFPIRCKKLIMPIFYTSAKTVKERRKVEDGHWFLAVVDTEKKKVLIFDSLQDSMRDVTEEIGKNLISWEKNGTCPSGKWTIRKYHLSLGKTMVQTVEYSLCISREIS
jgi:Ulp1 family protease